MSAVARQYLRQLKLNGTLFVYNRQCAHAVPVIKYNYRSFAQISEGPRPTSKCTLSLTSDRPSWPRFNELCYLQIIREKHSKKKTEDWDSSDDEEQEVEWKNDQSGKDFRISRLLSNSLRTDLLVKAGLGLARNKVETLFYESKIRVNGEKIFKKSSQLKVGDEIDIIRGPSPLNDDFILVSRIEIMSSNAREDGALIVQLRTFKSLTIENYDNQ